MSEGEVNLKAVSLTVQLAIIFPMPGSDTKKLTEVEKWKIYAEVCKWTDQKTGKIVNNGIERIIEGVKVENIKVKERTVKKIKQAVDEFRRQGKPADLS